MTVRKWLAMAAVTAGCIISGTSLSLAADKKTEKVEYTFGTLRTATAEEAKAKAEAWLKMTGKNDPATLEKIWSQDDVSILDKVSATISFGHADAAKLLKDAANADKTAPKSVPALLKDEKLAPFLRSNLALAYAKHLATHRVYEEALGALKLVQVEQVVDPSAYLFFRAVSEHALIKREDCIKSIIRLMDDVTDAPERYKMLATIMFMDLQGWKKDQKDLGNIAKLMDNVERRLDLGRGGPETQDIQKKIVFRLDELIKEMENQAKGGACNGGNCPSGGQPKPGNGGGAPNGPMADSNIATNGGKGTVEEKKLREYTENWGKMNERERAAAMTEITRDLPPRYKVVIEEYFKSLSRTNP